MTTNPKRKAYHSKPWRASRAEINAFRLAMELPAVDADHRPIREARYVWPATMAEAEERCRRKTA